LSFGLGLNTDVHFDVIAYVPDNCEPDDNGEASFDLVDGSGGEEDNHDMNLLNACFGGVFGADDSPCEFCDTRDDDLDVGSASEGCRLSRRPKPGTGAQNPPIAAVKITKRMKKRML